ncbi:MAG TPA: pantoate--beta-alanine ligase [Polyangiales bacterium]|nr:pantoate--beta-alanine ligase [Polyangiales bacterium]
MTVEIVKTPSAMRARSDAWRVAGKRIAFVPTMGYLHDGHVSLLEEGRRRGDVLVLSIFVNPTQFGPKEDLSRYPRDLEGDLAKAERAGVDVAYVPDAAAMYPDGYQTFVEVEQLQQGLCGASRPGHFRGVATVVLKLLNVVQPTVALFGMKDYQQLQVIRRMARDLDVPSEIVGMPIVREPDGLAMSSRNAYLSPDERKRALVLSRALDAARTAFAGGERDAGTLLANAREVVDSGEGVRLDYLELRDGESLELSSGAVVRPAVMAIAVFVGRTRLIDNLLLAP